MSIHWSSLFAAVAGIALWPFAEYLIHRFLGHYGKGRNPFAVEHLRHHATTSYFAPNWKKALVALAVIFLLGSLGRYLIGTLPGISFALGFTTMYGTYELMHRRAHTHPPRGRYSRWMRLHHFHHHFRNPRHNHGVTMPFWDMVFGTYDAVEKVRVPRKHAMDWLVDDQTGQVYPRFADDYELSGRGSNKVPPQAIPGVG